MGSGSVIMIGLFVLTNNHHGSKSPCCSILQLYLHHRPSRHSEVIPSVAYCSINIPLTGNANTLLAYHSFLQHLFSFCNHIFRHVFHAAHICVCYGDHTVPLGFLVERKTVYRRSAAILNYDRDANLVARRSSRSALIHRATSYQW